MKNLIFLIICGVFCAETKMMEKKSNLFGILMQGEDCRGGGGNMGRPRTDGLGPQAGQFEARPFQPNAAPYYQEQYNQQIPYPMGRN